jgi:hypothetical protein
MYYSAHQTQYNLDQSGLGGFEPKTIGAVVAFKSAALFTSYIYRAKLGKENLTVQIPQSIFFNLVNYSIL